MVVPTQEEDKVRMIVRERKKMVTLALRQYLTKQGCVRKKCVWSVMIFKRRAVWEQCSVQTVSNSEIITSDFLQFQFCRFLECSAHCAWCLYCCHRGSNFSRPNVLIIYPLYAILWLHGSSGVKMYLWTKSVLRGRGGCYKYLFYSIESHWYMETNTWSGLHKEVGYCHLALNLYLNSL